MCRAFVYRIDHTAGMVVVIHCPDLSDTDAVCHLHLPRLPFLHHEITEWHPMTSAQSRLRVVDRDGVACIGFVDRNILDEANIQRIGEEIGQIIDEQQNPKVVLNFENVDHLSSAALGTLITINNKMQSKDGQLRLAAIDPQIYDVFVITKLNKLFKIYETVDEALDSFS